LIRIVVFLFFFNVFFQCFSQVIDVHQPLVDNRPFFNSTFIKNNKITSITGSISSKKVKDIIRKKGVNYYYEFNSNGKLKKHLSTHLKNELKDSITTYYSYTEKGKVNVKRKTDNHGYYSYRYLYDDLNRIILQTYSRDKNSNASKDSFKLKEEYIITSDSFVYEKYDSTHIKKLFYNSYRKVYKEQNNYFNTYGYLIEIYSKYIIGNRKEKITYEYDEKGRLAKENNYFDIAKNKKNTTVYVYDNNDNILSIKYFNEDKHISTKEFLYDKKTFLLTAQIIQDIASEYLQIIQYNYTFL